MAGTGTATASVRADWNHVALAWGELHEHTEASVAPVTERLLTLLEPAPGETILELGCGMGTLGMGVAQLVGSQGTVIVSDIAEGMVAAARRRAEGVPAANVQVRVLDGQAIDLPDQSVDAVVCRMGYMLMPDPQVAFAEARRVLRDSGRLVLSVWSGPEHNAWALVLGMAVMQAGLVGPDPFGAGGLFSLSDKATLGAALSGAGFPHVRIDQVDSPHGCEDVDSCWQITSRPAGPLAAILSELPGEKLEEIKRHVVAMASQYERPKGVLLPGQALVVSAS
jgi:SAM-dependent methyltransferase